MAWATAGLIAGSIASGVGGAALSSSAAGKAADTQAGAALEAARLQKQASDAALAEQKRQFDASVNLLKPWHEAGQYGLSDLLYGLGMGSPEASAPQFNTPADPYGYLLPQRGQVDRNQWFGVPVEGTVFGEAAKFGAIQDFVTQAEGRYSPAQLRALLESEDPEQRKYGETYQWAKQVEGQVYGTAADLEEAKANYLAPLAGGKAGVAPGVPQGVVYGDGTPVTTPTYIPPQAVQEEMQAVAKELQEIAMKAQAAGGLGYKPSPEVMQRAQALQARMKELVARNAQAQEAYKQHVFDSLPPTPEAGDAVEDEERPYSPPLPAPPAPAQHSVGFGELNEKFVWEPDEDPSYQFRLAEGQKALERSAAARGGVLSGRSLKEAERFSQDYASQEYMNSWNRFQHEQANRYNRLAALAGVGQVAGTQLGAQGSTYAGNIGNILVNSAAQQGNYLTGAANATASGYLSSGNAWAQALGGAGQNLLNYAVNRKLNKQPGEGET